MAYGPAGGVPLRRSILLALVFVSYDRNPLQAESRLGKWARHAMVAGYCAASAVDGWQSTRPGVYELNPALRGPGGLSVPRMITFKAVTCGGAILADRFGRGNRARTIGAGAMFGAQVLVDIHNGKDAR